MNASLAQYFHIFLYIHYKSTGLLTNGYFLTIELKQDSNKCVLFAHAGVHSALLVKGV